MHWAMKFWTPFDAATPKRVFIDGYAGFRGIGDRAGTPDPLHFIACRRAAESWAPLRS